MSAQSPTPSSRHDAAYKLLFSFPEMVRDLLVGFVHQRWVAELDLSTLERWPDSRVSDDLRQRHQDRVWRVRFRDRWLYMLVLLEFQSVVDRSMALRVLAYTALLYQDLMRARAGSLPPVFPVVLYNGRHPWTAAEDVSDLLATVGAELAPFQPSQRYFLLDVSHNAGLDPSGPEHENLVSALVRLESGRSPGEMLAALDALRRRLSGPGDENLKRAFREWARQVELPEEVMARVRDVTEGEVMLRERVKEWTEQWKEEGRVELIHRQVARKFDRATADRFKERLERMRDTNQAAEAGIWILECESAEELLSRLERAPAPDDAGAATL